MRFLDNVLHDFIKNAPDSMKNAVYSARMERSVGLGAMGFHSFLQKKVFLLKALLLKAGIQIFQTSQRSGQSVLNFSNGKRCLSRCSRIGSKV